MLIQLESSNNVYNRDPRTAWNFWNFLGPGPNWSLISKICPILGPGPTFFDLWIPGVQFLAKICWRHYMKRFSEYKSSSWWCYIVKYFLLILQWTIKVQINSSNNSKWLTIPHNVHLRKRNTKSLKWCWWHKDGDNFRQSWWQSVFDDAAKWIITV